MDSKKINILKKKLEENKTSLEESLLHFAKKDHLKKNNWDAVFPKMEGGGTEGRADEVEEYSSLLPVEHSLELKLKNVDEALERIKQGTYGKCKQCEKEISFKKLSITPETKTCKSCS